jgi:hypothetical protein
VDRTIALSVDTLSFLAAQLGLDPTAADTVLEAEAADLGGGAAA